MVGLDASQRHGNDVPSGVTRQCLDQRRFTRPGGSVQEQAQLMGVPLDRVFTCLSGIEEIGVGW